MKYAPTPEPEVVVLFGLFLTHLPQRFQLDEVHRGTLDIVIRV